MTVFGVRRGGVESYPQFALKAAARAAMAGGCGRLAETPHRGRRERGMEYDGGPGNTRPTPSPPRGSRTEAAQTHLPRAKRRRRPARNIAAAPRGSIGLCAGRVTTGGKEGPWPVATPTPRTNSAASHCG